MNSLIENSNGIGNIRQDVVTDLAQMVIDQAAEHGFPVEVDAIRDAVDEFAKFSGIDATEQERVAASIEAERKASDVNITATLTNADYEVESVEFNALDVLKYHGETRTWQELILDESHQFLQRSLAEDYALYHFKRRFGDQKSYEVDITAGLTPRNRASSDDRVIRFVVTHIDQSGLRVMCGPGQGRMTYETAELARQHLEAMMANNPVQDGRLAGAYGLPLEVRPVLAYPGHFDPTRTVFVQEDMPRDDPFLSSESLIQAAARHLDDALTYTDQSTDQLSSLVAAVDDLIEAAKCFSASELDQDPCAGAVAKQAAALSNEVMALMTATSRSGAAQLAQKVRDVIRGVPGFTDRIESERNERRALRQSCAG